MKNHINAVEFLFFIGIYGNAYSMLPNKPQRPSILTLQQSAF
ncbi:hypothetical protein [Flavobacterium sp. 245]|nr:hypothetical protein [Flavobacterium sp. 245]